MSLLHANKKYLTTLRLIKDAIYFKYNYTIIYIFFNNQFSIYFKIKTMDLNKGDNIKSVEEIDSKCNN